MACYAALFMLMDDWCKHLAQGPLGYVPKCIICNTNKATKQNPLAFKGLREKPPGTHEGREGSGVSSVREQSLSLS